MKEKFGAIIFGIGIVLLGFSITQILGVLSTRRLDSNASIIAFCYLASLIGMLILGSYLNRSKVAASIAPIEYVIIGTIGYLLTSLVLDGGRLQRATNYALIPYLILLAIIYLRWKRRTWLDLFLLKWAWLPSVVILTPIFYRAFEGNPRW